ncbi:plasmid pRiA4b ORF-3 family protein [Demequina silvatica]|uniref:plasmid pRiA4b ORF-3 family protein n=1 Tax=Demequina silvatica TaxID=1638988 RepID=UPI00078506F8|nr:plasmid pRiA4b ORF-3 family protein [Demequina silvatica]
MSPDTPDAAEFRRRFDAIVAGQTGGDLNDLLAQIPVSFGPRGVPLDEERPELRRVPLEELHILTLTVDIDAAHPRIWRQVEILSDTPLAVLHEVLMDLFSWAGGHLWRFALGGGVWDHHSQLFLCPFDIADGDTEGTPAGDTRLDEVLRQPGEVLRYIYDYGDSWEMTIRVDAMRLAADGDPVATCIAGERAAPPEDCGGVPALDHIAELVENPEAFDVDEVNSMIDAQPAQMKMAGVNDAVAELVLAYKGTALGSDLVSRAWQSALPAAEPTREQAETALAPILWFLRRAGDGLPLTAAGYLKPAVLKEAAAMLPAQRDRPWAVTREVDAHDVLHFRLALRDLGLLRKYKDQIRATAAGTQGRDDPVQLWRYLASRLRPKAERTFEAQASTLVVLYLATNPEPRVPWDNIAALLSAWGWRHPDGQAIEGYEIPAYVRGWEVLLNLEPREAKRGLGPHPLSPVAQALARSALG